MNASRTWALLAVVVAAGCGAEPHASNGPPASAPVPSETGAPSPSGAPAPSAAPAQAEVVDEGGRELFRAEGVDGAFVVLDVRSGRTTVVNPEMASRGFLPASTFKIPNTLIGLTTGVIPDERFSLKWDGKKRPIDEWNADHDLTSAMRNSVVWYYQEVARRIGAERMQKHVTGFRYGNKDIGGGIDAFWLNGALRISPREQVDFLRRLRAGELPVSAEHAALVQRLLAFEEAGGVTMRWKTGLTEQGSEQVGWMVGFVEKGEDTSIFAAVLTGPLDAGGGNEKVVRQRTRLPRRLLGKMGMVPPALAESTRWK